tara:strand:- start:6885 stop:8813 length:1929 start_codon:yes stop_codon:yes gene_type:complete
MSNIIGGPAVRRIEPGAVYIWLALDQEAQVEAKAFKTLSGESVAEAAGTKVIKAQLGESLFFYLLKLTPPSENGKLPTDAKLYYNIYIDGADLAELGLTDGAHAITYPGQRLPSFVIPTQHKHIIEGSCRKPHPKNKDGSAQRDQLIRADRVLADNITKASRPTMLCLTGDQIYADDVATSLLPALTETGSELVGGFEIMPPKQSGGSPTHPNRIKLENRSKVLNKNEGFTSKHGKNHLMSLGEYAAMYLAVWGGKSKAPLSWDEAKPKIASKIKSNGPKPVIKEKDYNEERERVEEFLSNTWRTRRLMANISTQTMFDDHEITDDWNLNEDIDKALRKAGSLGRRLTANGLAAYWAFQGWGNDPDSFDKKFIKALEEHYADQNKSNKTRARAAETELHEQYWSYTVPGFPAMIALDTRTSRSFIKGDGPRLLSPKGFDWLEIQLKAFGTLYNSSSNPQTLLVLSPAPVFGFRPLEVIQSKITKWFKESDTLVDAEYWTASPTAYRALLRALGSVKFAEKILLLSGDVHYSFAAIEPKVESIVHSQAPTLIQITSSATCNHPSATVERVMDLIDRMSRIPDITYLLSEESSNKVVNGDNNIASIRFKDALPDEAEFYYYEPKNRRNYTWTYNLKKLKIREPK